MLSDEIRKNAQSIIIKPQDNIIDITLENLNKVFIYNRESDDGRSVYDNVAVNDLNSETWSTIDDIYEKNIGSRYSFRDYRKIIEFDEIFIDVNNNRQRINPYFKTTFHNHIIRGYFSQGYLYFKISISNKINDFLETSLNISEDKQREVDLYILNNRMIPAIESIVVPDIEGSIFHKCKDYYIRCGFSFRDNSEDNYRVLRLDRNYYSLKDINYINSDIWEDVEKLEVRSEVSCEF